jgi:hypothetical protein
MRPKRVALTLLLMHLWLAIMAAALWLAHRSLLAYSQAEPPRVSFAPLIAGVSFSRSQHDVYLIRPEPSGGRDESGLPPMTSQPAAQAVATRDAVKILLQKGEHREESSTAVAGPAGTGHERDDVVDSGATDR